MNVQSALNKSSKTTQQFEKKLARQPRVFCKTTMMTAVMGGVMVCSGVFMEHSMTPDIIGQASESLSGTGDKIGFLEWMKGSLFSSDVSTSQSLQSLGMALVLSSPLAGLAAKGVVAINHLMNSANAKNPVKQTKSAAAVPKAVKQNKKVAKFASQPTYDKLQQLLENVNIGSSMDRFLRAWSDGHRLMDKKRKSGAKVFSDSLDNPVKHFKAAAQILISEGGRFDRVHIRPVIKGMNLASVFCDHIDNPKNYLQNIREAQYLYDVRDNKEDREKILQHVVRLLAKERPDQDIARLMNLSNEKPTGKSKKSPEVKKAKTTHRDRGDEGFALA